MIRPVIKAPNLSVNQSIFTKRPDFYLFSKILNEKMSLLLRILSPHYYMQVDKTTDVFCFSLT